MSLADNKSMVTGDITKETGALVIHTGIITNWAIT